MELTNEQLGKLTAGEQEPVEKQLTAIEVALTASILEPVEESIRGMVEQKLQEQRNNDDWLRKGGQE